MLNRSGNNGVNANGMLTSYTPNALNQYTNVGGAMGYDANFNLTSYSAWGGWTYQFNAENQLTSAGAGSYASFVYDALGRCVKRTIGGDTRLFAYDGWKPTVEFDAAGNELAWNIYGPGADEILWRYVIGVGHLRYHLDRMNNVRFITDVSGNPLEKYTYDPFGWPTVVSWVSGAWDTAHPRTGSLYGNRFMFTGREFFGEMGIMDFRNRWYHPNLGRFLQPDPTGFDAGDMNLFRYCGGDPVNKTDSDGLFDGDVVGMRPFPRDQLPTLGPRGQLFMSGLGNFGLGIAGGIGVAGLGSASFGTGSVAAITVFGHAAVFTGVKGISQMASALAGTTQQMQESNAMPTNISSAAAQVLPTGIGQDLQLLEGAYSFLSAANTIANEGLSALNAIDLTASSVDLVGSASNIFSSSSSYSPPLDKEPFTGVIFGLRVPGEGYGPSGTGGSGFDISTFITPGEARDNTGGQSGSGGGGGGPGFKVIVGDELY